MKVFSRTRRELILYATPSGELAERCADFFVTAARTFGPTSAQTYPPHCTLTGFFHRSGPVTDAIVERVADGLAAERSIVPANAVEVVDLRYDAELDWVGIDLHSPWLAESARRLLGDAPTRGRDDPVRFKTWLHVSLAYGERPAHRSGLTAYYDLARRMIDPAAPVAWTIGLWERGPGNSWRTLATGDRPVTCGDSPRT